MAETIAKTKQSQTQITLTGKVVVVEEIQGRDRRFYLTRIVIPAPDEYTRPQEYPVYSDVPIGREGDLVTEFIGYVTPSKRQGKNGGWFDNISIWDKPPQMR